MAVEIRSYRRVFDLERRIYRIDRVRLNPGGVPVRGLLYFLAALAVSLLAARLPLLGGAVALLPWYLRELAMPAAIAAVMGLIRIDGRPFHLAAIALLRFGAGPRHMARAHRVARLGHIWAPDEMVMLPDGSDQRMRRMRYVGPGALLVRPAHERIAWSGGRLSTLLRRPDLTVAELPGKRAPVRAKVLTLADGARLETRGTGTAHRSGASRTR